MPAGSILILPTSVGVPLRLVAMMARAWMPASAVSSISRYVLPLPLPERGGSIEVLRSFDVKRHHRYFLTNDRELTGMPN